MEVIGLGLQAIGSAVGAWATTFGFIYVVGFLSKTFLIFMNKGKNEDFKDWFSIFNNKKGI